MVTPAVGSWVRLVALRGVSSPTMRAQVGEVGTVLSVLRRGGEEVVQAAFSAVGGVDDVFWLKPGEWELVGVAAPAPDQEPAPPATDCPPAANISSLVENPPARDREEIRPVTDFATAVQTRIEQLAGEDAAIADQLRDLAARRLGLSRERKALEAAVAAYNRVRGAGPAPAASAPRAARALPPRSTTGAAAYLRRWAAEHGGEVVLAAAREGAAAAGLTADQVGFGARSCPDLERVARGVYRLRAEGAA